MSGIFKTTITVEVSVEVEADDWPHACMRATEHGGQLLQMCSAAPVPAWLRDCITVGDCGVSLTPDSEQPDPK